MRHDWPVVLLLVLASGCLSDSGDGGDDGVGGNGDDRAGYRDGVVFFNEDYTVSTAQPAAFQVDVEVGARTVILEIQMDSGVMPNLHVELTGCGEVDPPSAGSWQSYTLCETPAAGRQTLRITVQGVVGGSGSGRALLRADLPDP
jgi:hypothetical protein